MTFSTHQQEIPSKRTPFGGTLHKICMICMFRCADNILLRKWLTTDIWSWSLLLWGRDRKVIESSP